VARRAFGILWPEYLATVRLWPLLLRRRQRWRENGVALLRVGTMRSRYGGDVAYQHACFRCYSSVSACLPIVLPILALLHTLPSLWRVAGRSDSACAAEEGGAGGKELSVAACRSLLPCAISREDARQALAANRSLAYYAAASLFTLGRTTELTVTSPWAYR